jgi:hypothetical protein
MNTKSTLAIRILSILLVLGLAAGLAGCGNTTQAKVLDEFMTHMAARDAVAAYALFSAIAKAQVPQETLEQEAQGNFGDLVQGYKDLTVSNMEVKTDANGTYADLSGTVNYEDDTKRNFVSRLDKEGDAWLVTNVNIE